MGVIAMYDDTDLQDRIDRAGLGPALAQLADHGDMTAAWVELAPSAYEVRTLIRWLRWLRPDRVDLTAYTAGSMQLVLRGEVDELSMTVTAHVTDPEAVSVLESTFGEQDLESAIEDLARLTV